MDRGFLPPPSDKESREQFEAWLARLKEHIAAPARVEGAAAERERLRALVSKVLLVDGGKVHVAFKPYVDLETVAPGLLAFLEAGS